MLNFAAGFAALNTKSSNLGGVEAFSVARTQRPYGANKNSGLSSSSALSMSPWEGDSEPFRRVTRNLLKAIESSQVSDHESIEQAVVEVSMVLHGIFYFEKEGTKGAYEMGHGIEKGQNVFQKLSKEILSEILYKVVQGGLSFNISYLEYEASVARMGFLINEASASTREAIEPLFSQFLSLVDKIGWPDSMPDKTNSFLSPSSLGAFVLVDRTLERFFSDLEPDALNRAGILPDLTAAGSIEGELGSLKDRAAAAKRAGHATDKQDFSGWLDLRRNVEFYLAKEPLPNKETIDKYGLGRSVADYLKFKAQIESSGELKDNPRFFLHKSHAMKRMMEALSEILAETTFE